MRHSQPTVWVQRWYQYLKKSTRSVASNSEYFVHLHDPTKVRDWLPNIGTISSSSSGGAEVVARGIVNID